MLGRFDAEPRQVHGSLFCLRPQSSVGRSLTTLPQELRYREGLHPTLQLDVDDYCDAPFTCPCVQKGWSCKLPPQREHRQTGEHGWKGPHTDEPRIQPSRVKESEKDAPTKDTAGQEKKEQTATGEEECGNIIVRGFWGRDADCILDMYASLTPTPNPTQQT
jgi:hypothetical protein